MNRNRNYAKAGFTLVELLVTIGIIAILSSVAMLTMGKYIERAKIVKLTAMMRYLHQEVSGINGNFDLAHRYTTTAKVKGKYNSAYLNAALLEIWEKGLTNSNSYGHKNPFSNSKVVLNSTSITAAFKNPAIFISYNNTQYPYASYVTNANAKGTVVVNINRNSMQVDVYYVDFKGVKSPNVLSVY